MKDNKFLNRIISALLLVATLLSSAAMPVFADGADNGEENVNFCDPASDYNVTVAPSDVLRVLYPDSLTDAEADYADAYFENAPIYSADVGAEHVRASVVGDKLLVTASSRSYTADNGETVIWTPVSATCGDQFAALTKEGDDYICELLITESDAVTVEYRATLSLPLSYIEALSNFAYEDARAAAKIKEDNSAALEKYLDAYQKYEEYLNLSQKYLDDERKYSEYLEKKRVYDQSVTEYSAYLSQLSKYESDLAAYQKYVEDYKVYEAQKSEYESNYNANAARYEEYKAYLANLAKIRASMAAIESIYVTPSNGVGPLFKALQNAEIIGMIERHQDKLVSFYGVKQSDITAMRETSDELTELLIRYDEARAESEQSAFEFYKQNYSDISHKFNYLYEKMTAVLTKKIFIHVCALLETVEYKDDPEMATYKKWRIRNVLCHIYLICNALDDTSGNVTKWEFYQDSGEKFAYDFSDHLAQNVIISDNNASNPSALFWQDEVVFDASVLTPPKAPAEVKEPVEPHKVEEPTPPVEVKKPAPPTEVEAPTYAPKVENYDLVIRTEEYLADVMLAERTVTQGLELAVTQTVTRPFSADGAPVVAYFNFDGELLSTQQAPGSPTRPSTPAYEYKFEAWRRVEDGDDVLFFAEYEAKIREYDVIFKTADSDTALYSCRCAYGEIPEFIGAQPALDATDTKVFAFSGWYPRVSAVKGDVEYIAQFTESDRFYEINWVVHGKTVLTRNMKYGEQVMPPAVTAVQYIGGKLYEFKGWDTVPAKVSESKTYTAQFDVTVLSALPDGGEGDISIGHNGSSYVLTSEAEVVSVKGLLSEAREDGSGVNLYVGGLILKLDAEAAASLCANGAQSFSVLKSEKGVGYSFTNSDGYSVRFNGKALMTLTNNLGRSDGIYAVYTASNGAMGEVECSATEHTAELVARPDNLYALKAHYSVTVEDAEGGGVLCDRTLYREGETVVLTVRPQPENRLISLTVTDSDGNVIDVTDKSYFVMPAKDVTVKATFAPKTYTVTFMSNGAVISTQEYLLGEKIIIPEIPLSFEKEGYVYTFVGWSVPLNDASVVTGTAVYEALYSSIPVELKVAPDTRSATDVVVKEQLIPIVCFAVVFAAAVSVIVVFSVKLIKRNKGRKR